MSGTHCLLRVHDGKAWVQDVSTNGSWLNGTRLVKGRWHVLVPGDLLSLRKVASFKVHLQAQAKGVTALCLSQQTVTGLARNYILAFPWLFWPAGGIAAWPQRSVPNQGLWLSFDPDNQEPRIRVLGEPKSSALGLGSDRNGWRITPNHG
jgi:hypothetical protein